MTEDRLELKAMNWLVDTSYSNLCAYATVSLALNL